MERKLPIFYAILLSLLVISVVQNSIEILSVTLYIKDLNALTKFVVEDHAFYISYLDIIITLFLEISLIFSLTKMKKWTPILIIILFVWTLSYHFYVQLVFEHMDYSQSDLVTLSLFAIIGGAIVAKTIRDRDYFQY